MEIYISPNDRADLLEILDYAAMWYELNRGSSNKKDKWDNTNWYLMRIAQLKLVIKGKVVQDSITKSSLGTLERGLDNVFNDKEDEQDNSILL